MNIAVFIYSHCYSKMDLYQLTVSCNECFVFFSDDNERERERVYG